MSFKSKQLSYSQNEPAFLRRIRGEIRGSVDDPDRQITPVARPTISKRLKKDEEDDAPTYVLEETNQHLSKEQYEAMVKDHEAAAKDAIGKTAAGNSKSALDSLEDAAVPSANSKQRVAEVGGLPKKRQAAKIIGQDDEEATDTLKTQIGTGPGNKDERRPLKRKKAKAIKLSFSADEES
ncbi:hypothetical protein Vi05172_g13370 [Venturia inaequalis]|nr:hypothetical protein Vi05172_g13370 [Venturia inaequalis]